MARIKRWPWDIIAICFTALLCAAFVIACVKVSDAFRHRDEKFTREQVATAQAENTARDHQAAQATARVRVVACEQANDQSTATILGNVRSNLAELQGFARAGLFNIPTDPAKRSVAFRALIAFAQEQEAAHPARDCSPAGLDRYYHQKPGTTAAALKG